MRKIVDYDIIYTDGQGQLKIHIKKYIEDGWQPYGYPIIGKYGAFQAMVKYETEDQFQISNKPMYYFTPMEIKPIPKAAKDE